MRTSIETRILSLFTAGAEAESFSISEIARKTGAAYPHVHAAVTGLLSQQVLLSTNIGKALYCSPNFESDLCRHLLSEAMLWRKETLLGAPNLKNINAQIRQLATSDSRLIAVILNNDALRFVITDKAAANEILKQTTILNVSFSTPGELKSELLNSLALLDGATVLLGYDRLLLLLAPLQQQLRLNHSALFRRERR